MWIEPGTITTITTTAQMLLQNKQFALNLQPVIYLYLLLLFFDSTYSGNILFLHLILRVLISAFCTF